MKKTAAILIFLLFAITACGSGSSNDITGVWELIGADGELVSTYEFTEDSYTLTYYTYTGYATTSHGTYTITDGKVTLFLEDGSAVPLSTTLSGDTLKVGIAQYKRR